jgi:two-component system, OmpR family, phosphate regulon response regulator PhoB
MVPACIMIFNDDDDTLDMYKDILNHEGYEVILHRRPTAIISDIERVTPDLIILDWMVGHERRGIKLINEIHAHLPTTTIPIVICTTQVAYIREHEDDLRTRGIEVMYKPFEVDDLFTAIKTRLSTVE